ncbi:MAG: hypothetical protein H8E30_04310 [Alphaproteobacteria bacterium]|nr:hypothetical protein [Alphaproteobacteria bacterium]
MAPLPRPARPSLTYPPPWMGIVRRDDRIPDAIRRQTAFLSRHPQADAAQDLEALATAIRNQPAKSVGNPA